MGSWTPGRVRVPPSGLGNGTLLGYGVFRMESHQDEAPPDAGGPYPGDWRPHETREGWTQTRGRDNVRRRCTRRRPRDEAAAIGAARRGPRQAGAAGGPPGAGGEAWAGWASDARREPAPHTSVCRPERQCRAERGSQTVPFLPPHRPANVGLAYTERPTRPRLSPRRPRGRWVFQLRGGD